MSFCFRTRPSDRRNHDASFLIAGSARRCHSPTRKKFVRALQQEPEGAALGYPLTTALSVVARSVRRPDEDEAGPVGGVFVGVLGVP